MDLSFFFPTFGSDMSAMPPHRRSASDFLSIDASTFALMVYHLPATSMPSMYHLEWVPPTIPPFLLDNGHCQIAASKLHECPSNEKWLYSKGKIIKHIETCNMLFALGYHLDYSIIQSQQIHLVNCWNLDSKSYVNNCSQVIKALEHVLGAHVKLTSG